MKKSHIIGLIVILVSIFIIISASKDVSTYGDFETAVLSQSRIKIVGQLDKSNPVIYRPEIDPNTTSFYLRDNKGEVKQVKLNQPKPQDFELAEQVVLTGSIQDEIFVADEILMKCPSKYKEEEILLKDNN
jgi:cytochrome c-type biogenesis protein CcmE